MKKILYIIEADINIINYAGAVYINNIKKCLDQEFNTKLIGLGREVYRRNIVVKVINKMKRAFRTVKIIAKENPDIIMFHNVYSLDYYICSLMCKIKGIKIINSIVDFYILNNVSTLYRWLYNFHMNCSYSYADAILSISTYGDNHFSKRMKKRMIIPALCDVQCTYEDIIKRGRISDGNILHLFFAGSVLFQDRFRERFDNIFQAIMELNKEGYKVHLDMYGTGKQELERVLPYAINDDYITFRGRIPNAEVKQKIQQYDFLITMRDKNIQTEGGFPSKLSEALSLGIPIIATLTSDMDKYLEDGINSYISSSTNIEDIKKILIRAYNEFSLEKLTSMRLAALNTAKEKLDYRVWQKPICDFINDL
jgi:glycosyltransferase involved in cell wall biosynthesis